MLKETLKKQHFEYNSPDGDKYHITYVQVEQRKFVQIGKSENDDSAQIFDVEMLYDLVDQIREQTSYKTSILPSKSKLQKPLITDHRLISPEEIQKEVNEVLTNTDDNIRPVQTLGEDTPEIDEEIANDIARRKEAGKKEPPLEKVVVPVSEYFGI